MNEQTITPATEVSFKDFLFKNKRNRIILILAAVAIVVQFGIFKYLYPFASFIHGDSFSYINAAKENLSINTYLIGYSKFLRLFSVFTKSDFALVTFQYLFIHAGVLFLLFTLFYFYKPSTLVQALLFFFMTLNPLFLHLANLISSDSFFVSLSAIWFGLLLWIINRPSNYIIFYHAIVLLIAFTVRYNALIYPLIAGGAFLLSKLSIRKKMMGIALGVAFCSLFIWFTSYQYKKLTGYWQYSPFSGWQMANNAMYAYRYVDSADRKPAPKKFEHLDKMIREYFDSTRDIKKYPQEALQASTVYMWTAELPLYKYRDQLFSNKTNISELKKWASMGPFYKEYGINIIKRYPFSFGKYFLWPNAIKYYTSPVEFLEFYNSGRNTVNDIAKNWFEYKSNKIESRMQNKYVWILNFYPILTGLINAAMLCTLLSFVILKGWRYSFHFSKGIFLGSCLWLVNGVFTIFASSAALRFQSFPIILTIIFASLLVDWMIQIITITNQKSNNIIHPSLKLNEDLAT
jgi:hypothetical protein